MKRIILLYSIITCLFTLAAQAQVGIRTTTPAPSSVLHIDAGVQGNTADDVLIDNQGRVGIGTITPTAKLHLKMQTAGRSVVIKDGSQQEYKMLTSNGQGEALWKFAGLTTVKGVLSPSGRSYLITSIFEKPGYLDQRDAPIYPLDATITLSPGRWCVYANFLLPTSGSNVTDTHESYTWIRLTYSDTYGGDASADIIGAPWTSGAVYAIPFGVVQGFIVILNNSGAAKTYHLGIVYADSGKVSAGVQINNLAGVRGENGIIAVKIANN